MRPKTYAASFRCDIRSIATLVDFYRQQGYMSISISETTRLSLEFLVDILERNRVVKRFESSSEALEFLNSLRLYGREKHRNFKTLADQIKLEVEEEAATCPAPGTLTNTVERRDEVEEMKNIMKERIKQRMETEE